MGDDRRPMLLADPLVRLFRIAAIVEGISLLLLLGIAMPLKYAFGQPLAVQVVGWIHGVLWIAFLILLAIVWRRGHMPFRYAFWAGIASVLPFGAFVFDRAWLAWLRRRIDEDPERMVHRNDNGDGSG